MKKKLIIGMIGLLVIGAGISVFAANTAQWVNVTARVEKEIEVNCVNPAVGTANPTVRQGGCAFGTVYPENSHELIVEVTASHSFVNNKLDNKTGVKFDVLWECKLQHDDQLASATNKCREDLPNDTTFCKDATTGNFIHCDPLKLDGGIRDYISLSFNDNCLDKTAGAPGSGFADGGLAKLKWLGSGVVDDTVVPKCLYHMTFTPPACAGQVNPNTDPHTPKTVVCNQVISDPDPQKWDRWADIGDNFKIQVYGFTVG